MVSILSGVLTGFKWAKNNWKLLGILVLVAAIVVLTFKLDKSNAKAVNLARDKAELQKTVDDFGTAFKALQDQTAAQILSLERQNAKERVRSENLMKTLTEIETSNETIACPVPDFLRRSVGVR